MKSLYFLLSEDTENIKNKIWNWRVYVTQSQARYSGQIFGNGNFRRMHAYRIPYTRHTFVAIKQNQKATWLEQRARIRFPRENKGANKIE